MSPRVTACARACSSKSTYKKEFDFKPTREGMRWTPKFENKWLNRIFRLDSHEANTIRQSHLLFSRALEQADNATLYERFQIPTDNFLAYQSVMNLHMWAMHKRFVKEGEALQDLHQELYDRHWDDATERIRELKVTELLINKNLTKLQQMSYGTWNELDIGEAMDDNNTTFGAGIWRSVFLADESAPEQLIEDMCYYLRDQLAMIDELRVDDFVWGRFAWQQPGAMGSVMKKKISSRKNKRQAPGEYARLR